MKKALKISALILGTVVLIILLMRLILGLLPFPELERFLQEPLSTRILDRQGNLLQVLPLQEGLHREAASLQTLPPYVPAIFLASEDSRFYFHPGVDPLALIRAFWVNSREKKTTSGASTITMQLARMIHKRPDGLSGKMIEMLDALKLECRLSKEKILELYLSNISFSYQTEGIASASRYFFGKPVSDVTPEEAAILAVIPRRPSLYSPLIHPENAIKAARRLAGSSRLKAIFTDIKNDSFLQAAHSAKTDQGPHLAPHFIQSLFLSENGFKRISGLVEVRTSLDLSLQKILETEIDLSVSPWKTSRMTQGSGIIIDNKTGEILAYSGSRDFNDVQESGQIDGVQNPGQPGSTLKPFLYALAMEKGFLPNTVLPDIPTDFGREHVYIPSNFNGRFNGPVRLRVALASSLNVPAVYTLQRLGVRNFVDFLLKAGFVNLESQKETLGVGLALGNAQVSLYELTRGFSLFPRGGVPINLTPFCVEKTESQKDNSEESQRLISPTTAGIITDILSDNPSRFTGFGHGKVMNTPFHAMFKTGTSNQYQNVWALGATPEYTLGIWMGNFKGETIIGRTGSGIPAKAVVSILKRMIVKDFPFKEPPDSRKLIIDSLSGKLATQDSPSTIEEWIPNSVTLSPDDWHTRESGRVVTNYPPEYSDWLKTSRRMGSENTRSLQEDFTVLQPADGAVFFQDPSIPQTSQVLKITTTAGSDSNILVRVNSEAKGTLSQDGSFQLPLYQGQFNLDFIKENEVLNRIKITVK